MRRLNPTVLALLGGLAVLALLIWFFTSDRGQDQDKLTDDQVTQASAGDAEKRCAQQTTYDFIKRDLFRRAAQLRGSDQAAFDRLAAYAVIRMENPVLESEDEDAGAANCTGNLSLDLPPGVAVVGGRRTLTAEVDYTVRGAADGSGSVVLLRNADAIVAPLATLARVGQQTGQPLAPPPGQVAQTDVNGAPMPPQPGAPSAVPQPARPPAPAPAPEPPRTASARPSFNCANAGTRGEIAVCADPGLASLDRQMASQFYAARSRAGPEERALLDRTRGRFLSYRDRCRTDSCIAEAYRGRMREISDIMAGRWRP